MPTVIEDKFNEAMEKKRNNVNSFVWKYPKDRNNENAQKEIRLIDCSEEELKKFHEHCMSMLRNPNKLTPGRYDVLNLIRSQKDKIGAELLLRELEAQNSTFTRFALNDAITEFIEKRKEAGIIINPDTAIFGQYYEEGISSKYSKLNLRVIIEACNDKLGIFDNSHITKSFLLKRGLWLTKEDLKTLKHYMLKEGGRDFKPYEIARRYLNLKDYQQVKCNSRGLNLEELKAMLTLRTEKIKDLTTLQLETLRYKLLIDLERNVLIHIEKWETLANQIEKVSKIKKYNL